MTELHQVQSCDLPRLRDLWCSLAQANLRHHGSSKTNHKAIIQGLSVLVPLTPELGDIVSVSEGWSGECLNSLVTVC